MNRSNLALRTISKNFKFLLNGNVYFFRFFHNNYFRSKLNFLLVFFFLINFYNYFLFLCFHFNWQIFISSPVFFLFFEFPLIFNFCSQFSIFSKFFSCDVLFLFLFDIW